MKIASKVFLILSIIASAIAMLLLLVVFFVFINYNITLTTPYAENMCKDLLETEQYKTCVSQNVFNLTYGVGAVLIWNVIKLLFPIIFASVTLKAIERKESARKLIPYGILSFLFVNVIVGILVLCISDKDLEENIEKNKERKEMKAKKHEEKMFIKTQKASASKKESEVIKDEDHVDVEIVPPEYHEIKIETTEKEENETKSE